MFPHISLLTRIIIAEAMQEQVTLAFSVSDLPVFTSAELPKDSEVCRVFSNTMVMLVQLDRKDPDLVTHLQPLTLQMG